MNAFDSRWCRLAVLSLVWLGGCSSSGDEWTKDLPETVPASGVLLLDGQPVEGASIVFSPQPPGEHAATALSGPGGRFELKAFPSKEGAVPGTYQVGASKTVEGGQAPAQNPEDFGEDAAHAAEAPPPSLWSNALPAQYATPANSGLTKEIPAGGTSDLKIELKSK